MCLSGIAVSPVENFQVYENATPSYAPLAVTTKTVSSGKSALGTIWIPSCLTGNAVSAVWATGAPAEHDAAGIIVQTVQPNLGRVGAIHRNVKTIRPGAAVTGHHIQVPIRRIGVQRKVKVVAVAVGVIDWTWLF